MKVLFIANSFGTDCTRYLHGIARANCENWKVVNLYIGGCSLYRHYRNMLSGADAYEFEINGQVRSGIFVSLPEVLLSDEWDAVVMQQCSPQSGDPRSYEPYSAALAEFIRRHAPRARLYIHQTWTFERGSPRFKLTEFEGPEEMLPAIKSCYENMAREVRAWGIIPNGEAMYTLWHRRAEYGIEAVHRDGYHADLGVGRYLLALTAYATLSGREVTDDRFSDLDIEASSEALRGARETAAEVTEKYCKLNAELAKEAL